MECIRPSRKRALLVLACCSILPSAHASPPSLPLGLPPILWPEDNPYTPEKAELGRILFFDGRLSSNGKVSCAFCHNPSHAFSGVAAFSPGVNGRLTGRHTPTLINRAFGKTQFWDGRAPTIESQLVIPLTNPDEMGMTVDKAVRTIAAIPGYAPLFKAAFGDTAVTSDHIVKSIATFERTIVSGNSRYDRFAAGDKNALTKEEKDGLEFFNGKGECSECHTGPAFTNEKFENLGIGMDTRPIDPGREQVTHKRGDQGKFKTPTLRDLSSRGPYMHDGRFKTLDEVVDFYAQGGIQNPHVDDRLLQFYLDEKIKASLVAFLKTLDGEGWHNITPPASLPQ